MAFNGLSAFSLGVRLLCLPLEALPFPLPNLSPYLLLSYLLWLADQVISLCFTSCVNGFPARSAMGPATQVHEI